MNLEQYATPATIEAIYKYYKDKRKNDHRPHLGGSQIGNECSRALWYQFRHAWSPRFDGRMLRLFETGDREEGSNCFKPSRRWSDSLGEIQRLASRSGSQSAEVTLHCHSMV